ncbi:peroxidase 57-like [Macadamia integrifolia]|uniref:peroxidase 57-like n=1 Tax=Macadamia integrifolia TaxID=60698 RepID=UPI001C5340B8|nr:peroxidase 57-like [Macadamia integrifolia]
MATVAFKLSLLVVLLNYTCLCYGSSPRLQIGYYKGKCPNNTDVEKIIKNSIRAQFRRNFAVVPQLLRLQFHDCAVRGCDASIFLDGDTTEKKAPPNLTVKGFDIIDKVKSAVEEHCPGVVSCADILIMAAREAVVLGGGRYFNVMTGRRDGLSSILSEAANLLPPAGISVDDSIALFANLGINVQDMVTLIGSHTVGFAHCSAFKDRLFNFNNTGKADPTMNHVLLNSLKQICPKKSAKDFIVNLDRNTRSVISVDNSFFKEIQQKKGVLGIDQEIDLDIRTSGMVQKLANDNTFFNEQFAAALVKLGAVNVLLEPLGEIRKSCRSIN